MAVYKKRGYKQKAVKEQFDKEAEVAAEELESTTAEVFNTLDETANKSEEWVAKNQKYIFGVIGGAVAYIVASPIKPFYQAWGTVMIETRRSNVVNIEDVYQPGLVGREFLETQRALFYSRVLAKKGEIDLNAPIEQVMTGNPHALLYKHPVGHGVNHFLKYGYRHMIIVDEDRIPIKVVSLLEVFAHLINKIRLN